MTETEPAHSYLYPFGLFRPSSESLPSLLAALFRVSSEPAYYSLLPSSKPAFQLFPGLFPAITYPLPVLISSTSSPYFIHFWSLFYPLSPPISYLLLVSSFTHFSHLFPATSGFKFIHFRSHINPLPVSIFSTSGFHSILPINISKFTLISVLFQNVYT